jgi:hypothetical protein
MDKSQVITVTIEVTDGVEPAQVVDLINKTLSAYSYQGDGYVVGYTEGIPAHAVAGEIYVPEVPGTSIEIGTVTLVTESK